jgi:hypothetical protein
MFRHWVFLPRWAVALQLFPDEAQDDQPRFHFYGPQALLQAGEVVDERQIDQRNQEQSGQ